MGLWCEAAVSPRVHLARPATSRSPPHQSSGPCFLPVPGDRRLGGTLRELPSPVLTAVRAPVPTPDPTCHQSRSPVGLTCHLSPLPIPPVPCPRSHSHLSPVPSPDPTCHLSCSCHHVPSPARSPLPIYRGCYLVNVAPPSVTSAGTWARQAS